MSTSDTKEIEFGDPPELLPVRRSTRHEIRGLAFVRGFGEPVRLTIVVDTYQIGKYRIGVSLAWNSGAKKVYGLLRELFKKYSKQEGGLSGSDSSMTCSWQLAPEKWPELLEGVETTIGKGWAEAFNGVELQA